MSDLAVPDRALVAEQECKEHLVVSLGVHQARASPPPCNQTAVGSGLKCHCRVIGLSVFLLSHIQKLDIKHAFLFFTGLKKHISNV